MISYPEESIEEELSEILNNETFARTNAEKQEEIIRLIKVICSDEFDELEERMQEEIDEIREEKESIKEELSEIKEEQEHQEMLKQFYSYRLTLKKD